MREVTGLGPQPGPSRPGRVQPTPAEVGPELREGPDGVPRAALETQLRVAPLEEQQAHKGGGDDRVGVGATGPPGRRGARRRRRRRRGRVGEGGAMTMTMTMTMAMTMILFMFVIVIMIRGLGGAAQGLLAEGLAGAEAGQLQLAAAEAAEPPGGDADAHLAARRGTGAREASGSSRSASRSQGPIAFRVSEGPRIGLGARLGCV